MKTKKNTELTSAERHLLERVKSEKKKRRKAEHERDLMKSVLLACGVRIETLDDILGERALAEPTEQDRYR